MYDVLIIGGSYAGMAAALQLLRARHKVAVVDAGIRRNRFASSSHGLLGQDGKAPEEIAQTAKQQLFNYPGLVWVDGTAISAEKQRQLFTVRTEDNQELVAKRLILATGVRDNLPEIPGLAERWGQHVFHCPYCHGYELNNGPLGVLAVGEISMHQALLIPDWGPTTLFTNGTFEPNEQQQKQLRARKVTVETERVLAISGNRASINLQDGRVLELAGLFVASKIEVGAPIAAQLGCEFDETPLGTVIKINELQETSVEHVFACGDTARAAGNVTFAIADGVLAGISAHRSLILEALEQG